MRASAKSMIIYKSIKLPDPVTLAHSRLYCLEPIGIGTELVESLTGYVERLAIAHCVKTSKLCIHEIILVIRNVSYFQKSKSHKLSEKFFSGNLYTRVPAINGMGITAKDWVQIIESITLNSNLHCLTTLTWRNVISTDLWLRPMRAWCSLCYQEQKNLGKTLYEQLLWTLRIVTVCIVHNCRLSTICPNCHNTQPLINTISRPGYCNKCQEWLSDSELSKSDVAECNYDDFNHQLRIANAVGELLASPPKITPPPERGSVTKSINMCLKYFTNGNKAAFCRRFEISPVELTICLKGLNALHIGTLLKICFPTGIEPLNFLQGHITFSEDLPNLRNEKQY